MKFYYVPGTCALASHITLEEAGADYTGVRMNFAEEEQKKPEFLAINPKARVPALVTERGVLTETPAILVYLCQQYPEANMAPLDDPFELARVQSFNSYLCSTVHVAHAHRGRGHRWADDPAAHEAMRAFVPKSVGECFRLIEDEMFEGPWVMGRDCTVCDFYLFTVTGWLEADSVDITTLPKIQNHYERLSQRPSVKRALAQEFA
ncbi:MAG: glutathione S-transferase [Rhodospirillaceae bacterium]|jgi:glutathione S-transferase|nr:glutathione S-transferase [Rhodospirillaceae bacterium]MBT4488977.1 glutathione S-transferase [Rhodospirillaceae bacterium]MBT5192763.1 glutathione S-transferase [Rhodospirillaceae bacterium]MBT5898439.1 glutathione S-transferase [Rhodospirillaceae bacterium]MBT6430774.1 glutathione S-transferase [Rhodospirillaceae bacterium]